MRSTTSKTHNRPQAVQYMSLTEKFARINLTKRDSVKQTDEYGNETYITEMDIYNFSDKLHLDVPIIYTQEDRRMMREELQKEIIKREMEIIERRTRKSVRSDMKI